MNESKYCIKAKQYVLFMVVEINTVTNHVMRLKQKCRTLQSGILI